MFVDVIPLLRMPRSTSTFTYRIPSQLEGMLVVGQLVRVPWRGKEVFAIVESLKATSTIPRVSELIQVEEHVPSWDAARMQALRQHAQEQCTSMASLAASLLPDVPKRFADVAPEAFNRSTPPVFHIKAADIPLLRAIAQDQSKTLVRVGSQAERLFLYKAWVLQTAGQTLILVPTLFDAQEIADFLRQSTDKRVTVWGGVQSKNARWKQWTSIRDGSFDVVVATRSGVFVPLKKLGGIIIDQEEDQDHRSWEGAPYYDVRSLSQMLATSLAIPCRRTCIWPRVETALSQTWTDTPAQLPALTVYEHKAHQGLLHDAIESLFEEYLASDGQVLIISSQVSAARAFLCLDCQYRWQCKQCGASLQERPDVLACDKCGYNEPRPSACPRCDSNRLRGFALGLESLERELPALLQVPAVRIGEDVKVPKRGILLATPYAWRRWSQLSKATIKAVLLFHPEKMLFAPDYRAQEWFAHYVTWHRIMVHDYLRAPLFIQTDLVEGDPLLPIVLSRDLARFRTQELPARERMHLPPYGESISLTVTEQDQDVLRALGAQLRKDFPDRVYGSVMDLKTHSTSWLIKIHAGESAKLDKLNDSIYSKALLYRNPETPLL